MALPNEERNQQARINRKLRSDGQQLFKSRAGRETNMHGEWFIKDLNTNLVVAYGIDWQPFEELAAELGVSAMNPDDIVLCNSGDRVSPTEKQVAS